MNIVMMTNTYLPHVGGVARSIEAFTSEYRNRGHQVLVVAPTFENLPETEKYVIRIPAIQRFNGTDFSVVLPIPGILSSTIKEFKPDVIHSHHPFLVGSTALRIAHTHEIPLVFTHHTKYEEYTHYVPGDSDALKRFVIKLSTNYANLCDLVFAPSESIAEMIRERGVITPIKVIPTGVDLGRFKQANGNQFRKSLGISNNAFVVGHLGRLAKEKNLEFLANSVIAFFKKYKDEDNLCFLLAGEGPMKQTIIDLFAMHKLSDKLFTVGILNFDNVPDAYQAMDVFAFSSKSETQGMVITEAMACGNPVVAIDAPGVREVILDGINGRLLQVEDENEFADALNWIYSKSKDKKDQLIKNAKRTAIEFSMQRSADKALEKFQELKQKTLAHRQKEYHSWTSALNLMEAEWERIKEISEAVGAAIAPDHLNK